MTTSITTEQQAKVLRMKEVWSLLGISRSAGYELLRDSPNFPKRVSLGPRSVGILQHQLLSWLDSQQMGR